MCNTRRAKGRKKERRENLSGSRVEKSSTQKQVNYEKCGNQRGKGSETPAGKMDKSRYKRPPDVEAALSSMLWTPYDHTTNTSDSLSDDEREREKRKLNRYSNPLPSSLNCWNSHVGSSSTLRYSYPYHGNCIPSTSSSGGQTQINTPSSYTTAATTTMVHSFTDDFYQYQVIKILSPQLPWQYLRRVLYVCLCCCCAYIEDEWLFYTVIMYYLRVLRFL